MNLEQINTSTTAGKAEVMRLAAEGRRVAVRHMSGHWMENSRPYWNWAYVEYAIITEPVGMEDIWVAAGYNDKVFTKEAAEEFASGCEGVTVVRYIRADLSEEVK